MSRRPPARPRKIRRQFGQNVLERARSPRRYADHDDPAHAFGSLANGAEGWGLIAVVRHGRTGGAYFAGRRFGRLRLAPRVSPNKTWEGVIGGMLFALAFAAAGVWWFALPALSFLPLCLAAAAFSVIGDLTESLLKRHVRLKDSGRLFPGHGGVLDRIDSATAATPVMALGLIWLGVGR